MKCNSCGAPTNKSQSSCAYCGAPLSGHDSLDLGQFVTYIEQEFKAVTEKNNGAVLTYFLALSLLWVIIIWFGYQNTNGFFFLFVLFSSGLMLFLVFGFFIIYLNNKAVREALDDKYRQIINDYLSSRSITKPEFLLKAKEVLDNDALLLKNSSYL